MGNTWVGARDTCVSKKNTSYQSYKLNIESELEKAKHSGRPFIGATAALWLPPTDRHLLKASLFIKFKITVCIIIIIASKTFIYHQLNR